MNDQTKTDKPGIQVKAEFGVPKVSVRGSGRTYRQLEELIDSLGPFEMGVYVTPTLASTEGVVDALLKIGKLTSKGSGITLTTENNAIVLVQVASAGSWREDLRGYARVVVDHAVQETEES